MVKGKFCWVMLLLLLTFLCSFGLLQVVGESALFTPDDIAFVQEAGAKAVSFKFYTRNHWIKISGHIFFPKSKYYFIWDKDLCYCCWIALECFTYYINFREKGRKLCLFEWQRYGVNIRDSRSCSQKDFMYFCILDLDESFTCCIDQN